MKTHTATFNQLIKNLVVDIDLSDSEMEDLDSITILEPSCNMDFCNRLVGITKEGKIITQQFDYDIDSRMENSFSDIIDSYDKVKVIETLQKYIKIN